jgi:DNA polymerase-3 subunit chi
MTQVDFYILATDNEAQRLSFCCRLIQKAVQQGNRVVVFTENDAMNTLINDTLWDFRPESYIPHEITSSAPSNIDSELQPVYISCNSDCPTHHDVLVNLSLRVPEFFSRFKRYTQVVPNETKHLERSRKDYRFFKERGYPVFTHKI